MPLQVEMEEGPRSKPVHFSGLQYCQYSQEKISLITLLSEHVRMYILILYCNNVTYKLAKKIYL